MLKARSSNPFARTEVRVILSVAIALGLASAASAAPIIPWASNQNSTSGTAAMGIEPNTSAGTANYGPAITFSMASSSSFSNIAYLPSTLVMTGSVDTTPPPAYVNASNSINLGYTGFNFYPTGPDPHNPGGNISPSNALPKNVNQVGVKVGSSVTINSGTSNTTDPYPYGTKLALSNSNAPWFPQQHFCSRHNRRNYCRTLCDMRPAAHHELAEPQPDGNGQDCSWC